MRRSFGARGGTSPNSNRGILKSFKRAEDNNLPHLSSSSNDGFDWVSINQSRDNDDEVNGFDSNNDDVFGSQDEVVKAVSALQLVVDPTHYSQVEDNRTFSLENAEAYGNASPTRLVSRVSSFGSESDWIEPSLHLCSPMMLQRHGSVNVYDALHLLQTEPSIKRMVVSLSSDPGRVETGRSEELERCNDQERRNNGAVLACGVVIGAVLIGFLGEFYGCFFNSYANYQGSLVPT